jgi:hypothetical protein
MRGDKKEAAPQRAQRIHLLSVPSVNFVVKFFLLPYVTFHSKTVMFSHLPDYTPFFL